MKPRNRNRTDEDDGSPESDDAFARGAADDSEPEEQLDVDEQADGDPGAAPTAAQVALEQRMAEQQEKYLRLAAEYAQVRKTFGRPICEHQAIQLKLGEMATRARAARLLTLDAAAAFDRRERCDMEAGMAKYFASEAALENATESMRIHGAYGYSKEFDIERLYRDAPLTCIGEGTNEMQRIIISKQWVRRNPVA